MWRAGAPSLRRRRAALRGAGRGGIQRGARHGEGEVRLQRQRGEGLRGHRRRLRRHAPREGPAPREHRVCVGARPARGGPHPSEEGTTVAATRLQEVVRRRPGEVGPMRLRLSGRAALQGARIPWRTWVGDFPWARTCEFARAPNCRNGSNSPQRWPTPHQDWPRSPRIWPSSPKFGRNHPELSESDYN